MENNNKFKIDLEATLSKEELIECRRRAIRQEELYTPKTRQERIRDNYMVLLAEYSRK